MYYCKWGKWMAKSDTRKGTVVQRTVTHRKSFVPNPRNENK